MESWETEDGKRDIAAPALPTPAETPRRTLSRASRTSRSSRKTRRSATPPRLPSSSPPGPMEVRMERKDKRSSREKLYGEEAPISALDPRRFTPTLHANLVSEILALRRDQEEKLKIIETLEVSLQQSREEQEVLQTAALQTSKEGRSLKRQLALLEGGTSSALGELARERDEAVEAITDTRKRLEVAQKKVRSQEEDSERVHKLWSKEKDEWEEEKRKYERKLHVADSRLKTVLDEVAHLHEVQAQASAGDGDGLQDERTEKGSDAGSIRTMSMTNSVRFSMMSGPDKANGFSLADELNFDGEDDDWQTDDDGRQSVLSQNGHRRAFSRDSVMSKSHQRNQSHESPVRSGSGMHRRLFSNHSVLNRLPGGIREDEEFSLPAAKAEYTDTGVQFSPPPSPQVQPVKPSTPEPAQLPKLADMGTSPRSDAEIEANQSRKRVYVSRPVSAGPLLPVLPPKPAMVSAACQTIEEVVVRPPTPPTPEPVHIPQAAVTQSTATQTDAAPVEQSAVRHMMSIPSISVIPPTSRPQSPQEGRLPAYTKDFGCQVSINTTVECISISVQTDEIRVDQRLGKLPPHLHPSAISSRPTSPAATNPAMVEEGESYIPTPNSLPPRNPRRLTSKRSFSQELPSSPPQSPYHDIETHDSYPGNNDDGPLSGEDAPMRRPPRISSLFAGFEASSDEGEDFKDGDLSDSEFQTALSAPRHTQSRQSQRSPPHMPSSPEQGQFKRRAPTSIATLASSEVYSSYSLADKEEGNSKAVLKMSKAPEKPTIGLAGSRMSVMRKAAMIQNGIATHQSRPRSPSLTDTQDPPFPIPNRISSRRPPSQFGASGDGHYSPTRAGNTYYRRSWRNGPSRTSSIRKSRSANPLPRHSRGRRQGSRSPPPPMSPSEEAPESPGLPPLPTNDITYGRPRDHFRSYRSHRSRPSTISAANTAITEDTNTHSVSSGAQASSVVDAIAQTMVGEWMFKYVRRRKSFGVGDVKATTEENSNDRHRRWVWLAPYERAILWSSKQPVSENALMGKPGRKLVIQSVLDVKDDNPPPKGFTQIFNRSILILTPERALKFTATSAERHYLWLTSLSFLAHSQQAVPEILPSTTGPAPPPSMGPAPGFEYNKPKLKRGGIRDSIRLTKGRNSAFGARNIEPNLAEEPLPPFPDHKFAQFNTHNRELSKEAAEPPFIPRFHERTQERVHERANQVVLHGRKRSNTGGNIPPPLSFRGFSGPTGTSSYHTNSSSIAGNSIGTAGSSDIYQSQASSGQQWAMSDRGSQRTSDVSSAPGNNFFEALGTVRMEAFISPLAFPRFEEHPDENEEWRYKARRRSKEMRRNRSRSRTRRDSYTSRGTRATGPESSWGGSRTTADDDYYRSDPFKGF